MNDFNWRPLFGIGILLLAIIIIVNVVFSVMWTHGVSSGPYGGAVYAPGMGAGPWMWGGMGFFWIFPIAGFFIMLLFFGLISRIFVANSGNVQPPGNPASSASLAVNPSGFCSKCGQPMQANWVVCPYCGTERPKTG